MYLRDASFHTYPRGWPFYPGSWLSYSKYRYRIRASNALQCGMQGTGIKTWIGSEMRPSRADIAVVWNWKQRQIIKAAQQANRPMIVMERGFLQSGCDWVSLSLNGLSGVGFNPPGNDQGERWRRHFSHHLRAWQDKEGYALLIGQAPGDVSLKGIDIQRWTQAQANTLRRTGYQVVYRPDPFTDTAEPEGVISSRRDLMSDLSGASLVVTYSSPIAVDAVLAGIPTCVEDSRSVAYPMASHRVDEPLRRPDRTQWCHELAWQQWSIDELRDGSAWRHLLSGFMPL